LTAEFAPTYESRASMQAVSGGPVYTG